jgi:hypothetical protein
MFLVEFLDTFIILYHTYTFSHHSSVIFIKSKIFCLEDICISHIVFSIIRYADVLYILFFKKIQFIYDEFVQLWSSSVGIRTNGWVVVCHVQPAEGASQRLWMQWVRD